MEFNTSLTDGSGNWQVICDAVTDEETTGNYGAFNYVNGLGDDWYLPAKDELEELICTKYDTVNAVLNSLVNHNSGNYSADRIYQDYHWSSSTYGKGVWKIYSGKNGKQILDTSSKAFSAYIRAIKKF
jgi:hypothetical protein